MYFLDPTNILLATSSLLGHQYNYK